MMIKLLKLYTTLIALFGTLGMTLQYTITGMSDPSTLDRIPIWIFYPILTGLSILLLFFVAKTAMKSPNSSSKTYLLFSSIKIIISLGLLIPYVMPRTENSKIIVINFFLIFFPLLLVETIGVVKLINYPFDEKNKNP